MKKLILGSALALVVCLWAKAADLVITNNGGTGGSGGTAGNCPGQYSGYVVYQKPATNGWGWKPTTTTNTHLIVDTNMIAPTWVEATAKTGARYCGSNMVSLPPSAPTNTAYRFTVYFPSNQTSPYLLNLQGFNP